MLRSLYLFVLLSAVSVLSTPLAEQLQLCGNTMTDAELRGLADKFAPQKEAPKEAKNFNLNVYWHVISADTTVAGGNIPNSQLSTQMNVFNQDFAQANAGVTWTLQSIDRSVNATWYYNNYGSQAQFDMKRALRKGGPGDLNVYSVGSARFPDGQYRVGYATFPWSYNDNPQDDGVVIIAGSLPGGNVSPFNGGKTLAHEAGHWIGLLHTFEGGCNYPGDYVDDTPYEASSASGCPVGRDTCTSAGVDPIRNHMDYSDDSCKNVAGFTAGQIVRFNQALTQFRGL